MVYFWFLICSQILFADVKNIDQTRLLPAQKTGKEEARKYFTRKSSGSFSGSREHFMMLHLGSFLNDVTYKWGGDEKRNDIAHFNIGVTYKFKEWHDLTDVLFRGEFIEYSIKDISPLKLSLVPLLIFPEVGSRFPIYFGAGIGLGIFFKNVKGESIFSLDYQLFTGVRFFDVLGRVGLFLEGGLKNHLHLFTNGQFNGVFLSAGTVFLF